MEKTINVALCAGRHEIPEATDGAIFPSVISDPTDVNSLEEFAFNRLTELGEFARGNGHINLFVTGLTVALVAVINLCCENGINLTLYHYDTASGSYFPQEVQTRVDADLCREAYGGYSRR